MDSLYMQALAKYETSSKLKVDSISSNAMKLKLN